MLTGRAVYRSHILSALVHVLLAALSLRVFTLVLLRQGVPRPAALAFWLVATGLTVLWAVWMARRAPATRVGLFPILRKVNAPAVVLLAFQLLLIWMFHQGYGRAASDGRSYFVQVRSLVIDQDFDLEEEIASFRAQDAARIYPVGTAILWAPFYTAGHLWLGVLNVFGGDYSRDGYSNPYQMSVGFGTLIYGFVGLVLIYRMLRCYFSQRLALVTVLALCCGSFLLWYLVIESSMTHGTSFFATTLFLWFWHKTRSSRTTAQWVLLGVAVGIMTLVRWQNGLFALILVADVLPSYVRTVREMDWARLRSLVGTHALAAVAAFVAFSPQLYLWRTAIGGVLEAPTARERVEELTPQLTARDGIEELTPQLTARDGIEELTSELTAQFGIQWFNPHMTDVLFSPNHGLLTWTPLIYLSVLGLVIFMQRAPAVGWLLTSGFIAQVYVNSVVLGWAGGSAFGARRFASCMLVFAVGLAAFLQWLRRHPGVGVAALAGALVVGNLFFMWDFRAGRLPTSGGITFDQMMTTVYTRLDNPFSFPANALFAWRYGTSLVQYDELGHVMYRNASIDLGEEHDGAFLTSGWSERERDPGQSFRWAVATESSLVVRLRERGWYRLQFRAEPFRYEGAPQPRVTIIVNGEAVAELELDAGWTEYQVDIPESNLGRTLTEIQFRYAYATSPLEFGISGDPRPLAVRFDYVRVRIIE